MPHMTSAIADVGDEITDPSNLTERADWENVLVRVICNSIAS